MRKPTSSGLELDWTRTSLGSSGLNARWSYGRATEFKIFSLTLDSSGRFVSGHSVCWRFSSRDLGFESCIQQRKTTCFLSIRKSLACASASKCMYACMYVCIMILFRFLFICIIIIFIEVVSSISTGSTIIYRFLCWFICVSLCQSIKIKSTNMYLYMYVCPYVCMYVCIYVYIYLCINVYVYKRVRLKSCMYIRVRTFYVCTYAHPFVWGLLWFGRGLDKIVLKFRNKVFVCVNASYLGRSPKLTKYIDICGADTFINSVQYMVRR